MNWKENIGTGHKNLSPHPFNPSKLTKNWCLDGLVILVTLMAQHLGHITLPPALIR